MTDPQTTETVSLVLARQAAVTGLVAAIAAVRNGKKAAVAASAAAQAAVKADATAAKADEIHEATTKLTQQAETIQQQTDGQLSHVIGTNEALQEILAKFMQILSAREGGKAMAVRSDDLRSGHVDLALARAPNGDAPKRRASDTDVDK
jgi:ribosomal protein L17